MRGLQQERAQLSPTPHRPPAGKIVSWLKGVGDKVAKGEPIVVVESDKADMDVEAFNDVSFLVFVCDLPIQAAAVWAGGGREENGGRCDPAIDPALFALPSPPPRRCHTLNECTYTFETSSMVYSCNVVKLLRRR